MHLKHISYLLLGAYLASQAFGARAEKNDLFKELAWEAAKNSNVDRVGDIEGILLEGNVIITQGTMRINASKLILKQGKDRARFGEGFGTPVFFTQKQEGREDYLEATADRLEFDERTNTVKLFGKAKLKLGKDQLSADYIVYNTLTERYEAAGAAPGTKLPENSGRVKGTLYPRLKDPIKDPTPAAAGIPPKSN